MDDCRCVRCEGDVPDDLCPTCDTDDCTCADDIRDERAIDAYEDRVWA